MGTLILAVTSLFLYSVGTALQALHFRGRVQSNIAITTLIGVLALTSHGLLIGQTVHHDGGFDFSFFKSSVLISWLIVFLLLGLNLKKPVQSLFLGVYPLAGLTIILALVTHGPSRLVSEQSYGMLSHIALSVTAYSLFTLAAIQAVLLYFQNRQLKHNYNSLLVRNLPPLQTMESLLFEMVWAGVVMLILSQLTLQTDSPLQFFLDDGQLTFVTPPLSMVTNVAILLAFSLFAAFVPAHRAARMDPAVALRSTA